MTSGGKSLRPSQARLIDVARQAGISIATASRAINNPSTVSEATRRLIEEAIGKLNYVPNGAARTLASQRSRTIGAIIPTVRNMVAAQTIDSFERVLGASGYSLLLASSENDPLRTLNSATVMVERSVDAVFVITYTDDEHCYELLRRKGVPFLVTGPKPHLADVPHVTYDHRAAALHVLQHLLDLGHRDFALLFSPLRESVRLSERTEAVRARLDALGLAVPESLVVEVEASTFACGREGLRRIQQSGRLPTAIVASNDFLAAGAIFECQQQGIGVPGDVSVSGYGDAEIASQMNPTLTTIRPPRSAIGELAARFLLSRLAGKRVSLASELEVELLIGTSTAEVPPKAAEPMAAS